MKKQNLATGVGGVCSVVLLSAGVLKATDLPTFMDTLHSWESLPHWAVPVVGAGLPFAEIVLGCLWLIGINRRPVALISAALVCASVTAFLIERQANPLASCGCFGKLLIRAHSLESLGAKLMVGGGLVAGWLLYVALTPRQTSPLSVVEKGDAKRAVTVRRGVTLVEILVVTAIVTLLTGIVAVALTGARGQARQTVGLSTLRSHGQAFASYTRDYGGVFPYFTKPVAGTIDIPIPEVGMSVKAGYFDASHLWHLVLAEPYYGVKYSHESFCPRGSPGWSDPKQRLYAGYWYSCTFLALPDYWDDDRYRRAPAQLSAIRDAQVRYPSDKALVIDSFSCRHSLTDGTLPMDLPTDMVFVDGSAAGVGVGEYGPNVTSHRTDETWGVFSMEDRLQGMHTEKGAAGRDRRMPK